MALAGLEPGLVIAIFVVVVTIASALVYAGVGRALGGWRSGLQGVEGRADTEAGAAAEREEEIRQMVQARSDRGVARGREALDVDAEVEKLLAADTAGPSLGEDRALRDEVRQLVIARNERRQRQGKEPLDVEREVDRQLRELENLGQ
jgi:hypothetical protein